MATLKSIAGKNGCGGDGSIATGKKGCQIPFGTPKHAIRLTKGTVIPSTTEFTLSYVLSLIAAGKAIVVMSATAFERLSGEDAMSTTSEGIESLNVLGLPKYKLTFQEGHEFYRQLSKLTGYKNSDWLIIDDSGNMKIALNSNNDFVGFTAGQVNSEMVMEKVSGGDAESKSLTIQFINRKQWDQNYTIVKNEQLGFDWEEVDGANPVNLELITVPTATDTEIVFSALLASDNNTPVEGMEKEQIEILVDGVAAEIATLTEADNEYTATIPVLTGASVISIGIKSIINIEDVLFSSETVEEDVL